MTALHRCNRKAPVQPDRQVKESAAVKNFFMWLGVLVALLFIHALTAKTTQPLYTLEVLAFGVWCVVGFFMAIRGIYRFVTKPRGPKGF